MSSGSLDLGEPARWNEIAGYVDAVANADGVEAGRAELAKVPEKWQKRVRFHANEIRQRRRSLVLYCLQQQYPLAAVKRLKCSPETRARIEERVRAQLDGSTWNMGDG